MLRKVGFAAAIALFALLVVAGAYASTQRSSTHHDQILMVRSPSPGTRVFIVKVLNNSTTRNFVLVRLAGYYLGCCQPEGDTFVAASIGHRGSNAGRWVVPVKSGHTVTVFFVLRGVYNSDGRACFGMNYAASLCSPAHIFKT